MSKRKISFKEKTKVSSDKEEEKEEEDIPIGNILKNLQKEEKESDRTKNVVVIKALGNYLYTNKCVIRMDSIESISCVIKSLGSRYTSVRILTKSNEYIEALCIPEDVCLSDVMKKFAKILSTSSDINKNK